MASQTLRTLKLSLLADVSEFGKGMGKAQSDFQKFSKGVEQASKVALGVIGAIGGVAVSAIEAASDLEETGAAIEQVFGPRAARQLDTFARNAAQALGQSRQQALSAAQTFGIFGTSAGLADDDLVDFTTSLVTLAGDLASFNNTDVDTAITALGAALRGESEPIRQYGVLLDAATLKNRALAEGIIETTDEALTPQQRTLAAYSEILAQTTLQQGDFARTSDGLANSQRVLQAEFENFRAELGEQLLPVVQELLPEIKAFLGELLAADPEEIIRVATSITQLAAAIVTLNAALKAFAAVQGAAKFLFSTGGALLVALSAGGSTEVERERAASAAQAAAVEATRTAPVGQRPRGNVPTTGPNRQIVVNGIVGSPYQVFRELERLDAQGRRAGIGSASTQ